MKPRIDWRRTALAVSLLLPMAARAAGPPQLTGAWARDDGSTRIAISPCGENLCAINTWVQNPHGKELAGDELILMLHPVSTTRLQGQAHDVRRNMNFSMTITLQPGGMQTSGCVLLGIICKTSGWRRLG